MMLAAILPSRNEPITIADVTRAAAAAAVGAHDASIVNVDASGSDETARNFLNVSIPIRKHLLRLDRPGKGRQILAGLRLVRNAECFLVIDTDTTNPSPQTYRALVSAVFSGADLAIADYPRFWYEGNLTNHVVRPLLLATTGLNVRQPLAGDVALSRRAVNALLDWYDTFSSVQLIRNEVDGYGIDVAIVLKSLEIGRVASVHLDRPKRHAVSFPHFRDIFHEETAVLLTNTQSIASPTESIDEAFRLDEGQLTEDQYRKMLQRLEQWRNESRRKRLNIAWPAPLLNAWKSARDGDDIKLVIKNLWPAYVQRAIDYLVMGHSKGLSASCKMLVDTLRTTVEAFNGQKNSR